MPRPPSRIYDSLAADQNVSRVLQDLAALRAGLILVDTATYDDLRQRMEPLTAPDRTFRHSARSLLALSAWRANDISAMRRWSEMVLADGDTPAGTRSQVQMLMAITASGRELRASDAPLSHAAHVGCSGVRPCARRLRKFRSGKLVQHQEAVAWRAQAGVPRRRAGRSTGRAARNWCSGYQPPPEPPPPPVEPARTRGQRAAAPARPPPPPRYPEPPPGAPQQSRSPAPPPSAQQEPPAAQKEPRWPEPPPGSPQAR